MCLLFSSTILHSCAALRWPEDQRPARQEDAYTQRRKLNNGRLRFPQTLRNQSKFQNVEQEVGDHLDNRPLKQLPLNELYAERFLQDPKHLSGLDLNSKRNHRQAQGRRKKLLLWRGGVDTPKHKKINYEFDRWIQFIELKIH